MSGRELWSDGRLRALWAARDWPALFRRYRHLAGISQRQLGELVGMTQGYVSDVERGRHPIKNVDVVARITEGLNVPTELGGVAQDRAMAEWAPSPELRERIAHAHATGRTDLRTADWIDRVLAEHRRAEDEVGG
ncbi:helix-turn-helix domain-containing protein, partial [Streptomyces sp. bgisy153]|uniref:helix-turn-helix domain-containing protein n=1 Tax=Streptomyces sp. bgisy153 TaxID=3413793 RepID=UPI003D7599C2